MQRGRRSHLEDAISKTLDRRRSNSTIRSLTTNHPDSIDFSSNDFLSLATSPELGRIFQEELKNGPSTRSTGSGGSRLLDGNSTYAERLERDIADFHNAEVGLLCNSGFDANAGLFSCLPQPGDVIVHDEFIHASVHDGIKLSRAGRCLAFTHNDLAALRTVLQQCVEEDDAIFQGRRSVFVAVESVYSMDGDIAPLKEIVELLEEVFPQRNGHLIVDEAHSTGCFGSKGRGLVCELGLEDKVLVRLHTFGKALACNGAIILCNPLIREYLVNYARPLIYTTFMSYPSLAAIKASYRLLMEGGTEPLAQNLHFLIQTMHTQLLNLQTNINLAPNAQNLLSVPPECPRSPIFSVLTSEPKVLAAYCQSKGFVVRGIVPPTVPLGAERVRICLHAGNTVAQIEGLSATMRCWVEQKLAQQAQVETTPPVRARL